MKKIVIANTLKPLFGEDEGVLSRRGLSVLWAVKAEEMVYLHKKEKADLIVADLEMPGMPIDRLCQYMRAERDLRAVSIIMVCPATDQSVERAYACGPNAVLVRPVSPRQLHGRMTELLNIADRGLMREIVGVAVNLDDCSGRFFGVSNNISMSGMLFETERILRVGAKVSCSFVLNYPVAVKAEIVRKKAASPGVHSYGIRFVEADARSRAVIDEYIKDRLRELS